MQRETIVVDSATAIAARVYAPIHQHASASVVIGGAMGVRQGFYEPFARWLAEQGYRVTTFDHRGHGDSLRGSLRQVRADLHDWARDYDAAIDHAANGLPGKPLWLLGHSLGAQLPGLLKRQERVHGLLSVAAGSGYWRDCAPRLRRTMLYFWHVMVPLATAACGYFPGRRLRKVGDLPAGVVRQWRRWCLNPRYSVGAEGVQAEKSYAAVRFPVLALSMSDDELMTWQGTQHLVELYANAPRKVERIMPSEVRARRIGHFGAFRREFELTLWRRLAAALEGLHGLGHPAPAAPAAPSASIR